MINFPTAFAIVVAVASVGSSCADYCSHGGKLHPRTYKCTNKKGRPTTRIGWGGLSLQTLRTLRAGDTNQSQCQSQASPAPSPPLVKIFQRRKVEALVADGAAILESKGAKQAFQEMSVQGTKWFNGSTYLFVYDLNCNVLFNAASPQKVGSNTRGHPDKNGKLFHDALVAQASTPNKCGWVDYMWPKPGQQKPSQKWTYSKEVSIDGKRAVLMSGFY